MQQGKWTLRMHKSDNVTHCRCVPKPIVSKRTNYGAKKEKTAQPLKFVRLGALSLMQWGEKKDGKVEVHNK